MSTRFSWTPFDAEPPSANHAPVLTVHSTARRPVLAFDASTEESVYFSGVAPQGLTGALTLVLKYIMASATTGGVRFGASVEAVTPGDSVDLDAAESFDTENAASDTGVPGTAGHEEEISITLTNADGLAAGDRFRVKLARKVAHADDTATGDCYVTAVELRDAA